jgi:hypothetical protein
MWICREKRYGELGAAILKYKNQLVICLLALVLTTVPGGAVLASVTSFTDARGTIHISNDPKGAAGKNSLDVSASGQIQAYTAINQRETTPSNIFPEPSAPVAPAFLAGEPQLPPESASSPTESDSKQ